MNFIDDLGFIGLKRGLGVNKKLIYEMNITEL